MGIINLYMRYFRKFQRNGILRRKLVMRNEKELEYRMSQKMFNEILSNRTEEEKKKIYPQNIMTDEIAREKIEEKKQNQLAVINKKNWFQKLLQKFRNKFLVR